MTGSMLYMVHMIGLRVFATLCDTGKEGYASDPTKHVSSGKREFTVPNHSG